MDRASVRSQLVDSSRAGIDMIAAKAVQSPELRNIMVDVALEEVPQVSARASRVIESCVQMDPSTLTELSTPIIRALPDLTDPSIRRSFLKIFITAPLPEGEEEQGILMDRCFRYLGDSAEPIAVKAYSMDILFRFTFIYPDISKELMLTLEELVLRDSSALCARGSYLLKQLRLRSRDKNS